MPSQRKQLNMRISEEAEARLGRLVAQMSAFLGNQYSQSDVVATALAWLELNLPAVEAARYIPPSSGAIPNSRTSDDNHGLATASPSDAAAPKNASQKTDASRKAAKKGQRPSDG